MLNALEKNSKFNPRRGPVVLAILDGVGFGKYADGDAVVRANTPVLDALMAENPTTRLKAHGTAVGMPSDDDMGNSEVGHNAIGSGRVFSQGAKLVGEAVSSGKLFEGEVWNKLIANVKEKNSALHLIGLVSDGNVHSHIAHLFAMLDNAAKADVKVVRVHALFDGRDVPETSAMEYLNPLEAKLAEISATGKDYRIASGGGRMVITMDRYGADWDMVKRGWDTHVLGKGEFFKSATEAVTTLRERTGAIDQDLPAFVISEDGTNPVGAMKDGDSVVLFNFRGDRALEITAAFESGDDFDKFDRGNRPDVMYAGMMEYDGDLHAPKLYLVNPPEIDRTMDEYLCATKVHQLAISETQKYGHVTYFFNGNRSGKFDDVYDEYMEIPSDVVPFEQRPWMKCAEITDKVI
ncbi:MAG: 2,3-bisphosphoglycerate-independent phosphoglycerate mutase, partial [Lentisphaeria bacterium]|nr:2,3-bisphosphoglycerate-independent phosphoglycerate mutase [Lentisphaeria bacterium]